MSTELSGVFDDILKQAAELPEDGPAAERRQVEEKMRKRLEDTGPDTFLLLDCSSSMWSPIGDLSMTKHDHLHVAVNNVLKYHARIRVIAFNSEVTELKREKGEFTIPDPAGSTDMAAALEYIHQFRPRRTIIVSDGMPDDAKEAELWAAKITGRIDTIYCGEDGHPAITWLNSLSGRYGGSHCTWDGYTAISDHIKGLLT